MLGGIGLLLILALVATTLYRPPSPPAFAAGSDERQEVVTAAVAELRNWPGVTYRGAVTLLGGGSVDADVTVAGDGSVRAPSPADRADAPR